MINYYELLQVPNFSNEDTIKSSYKTLMLKHHPDKGGDVEIVFSFRSYYIIKSELFPFTSFRPIFQRYNL